MTQAERIREYYKDHPSASYDEVAKVVGTTNSNVRANLAKDIRAGRCVRLEDKSFDYSPYFNHTKALTDLVEWKNDTRREWVDMLTKAAEKETDSNVMRLLIKEANKLMKEVTK
nr:MAG TPA: ethanolamine utilization protein [Caudoviricetes sp.]